MSPQNDTPQDNDEATQQPLSATHGDENPKTHTEVPNRDESDETMTAFKPTKIGMEIAERTIARAEEAAQRAKDAEAELAAALDVIGRRTDIVAVQLPEPENDDGVNRAWKNASYWHQETDRPITIHDVSRVMSIAAAESLAADLLAATAARADAAEGDAT